MDQRAKLQQEMEDLLGTRNVYFQPPPSIQMGYPAVVYSRVGVAARRADNSVISYHIRYQVTLISRDPEDPLIEKILMIPYCSHDRSYKQNNLNHDVFTVYR